MQFNNAYFKTFSCRRNILMLDLSFSYLKRPGRELTGNHWSKFVWTWTQYDRNSLYLMKILETSPSESTQSAYDWQLMKSLSIENLLPLLAEWLTVKWYAHLITNRVLIQPLDMVSRTETLIKFYRSTKWLKSPSVII